MTKFTDLNLNPKVLKAIEEAGYDSPTPIQAGAIPPALTGRDVLGIAQTGTGKTASFTLPMITMLARGRARARMPRSLVLCPTRELAAQVAENFDTYAKYTKLTKALLIGGVSFKEQDKLIDKGVDVLIATPGRLLDHHERGKLILTDVKVMVIDEADRMLDMGFIPDIERIFGLTPFTRQTLFFSATMAPEIERITNTFLSNPERIEMARQATTSENIEQGVVMFKASRKDREATEKRKVLRALIDLEADKCTNAIIFCNRKMDVDAVAKSLKKYKYDAAPIHGDLDQSQRTRTLEGFRNGELRFLVASDVAARGLDVPSVSHVFNFDVPSHAEDYVHRIGRTGRAGRDGKAIMICSPRDEKNFEDVERLVQKEIPRVENPLATKAKAEAPAAEAAAPSEEAAPTTEKPKRTRSRSRKKPETVEAAATEATADAPAVEETKAPEAKAAEAKVSETPKPEPKSDRRTPRSRSGGRKNDRRDDRNSNTVVGLGDHTPSFIEFSFADRPKN
ncbi:DEAD/DEAH box helicase [Sulfitobacter donghicola]|uniref:DEAD-box ATP-dependent RNA helicase RhpA n=1 Tax=Sulfitobacter donghicola DSW-25 = KCTC 12864 = JCM 14565 TaxID=1300350 RepID=A0A073IIV0_9RHOB|nr:DEAD/DEAH box helicase [Sulfitobacter donghicola]KEJ89441.1 DEAD/DEAH box helicase [Sulfitobacter donghicola DSW-25 = KCTC 12864 = JCM 14565]KIN69261.1 ATP-dependent RNA helicase RhlE [Sulfitobacter donghicola DSW-25 = KCTC 12864 = JCM 14565]